MEILLGVVVVGLIIYWLLGIKTILLIIGSGAAVYFLFGKQLAKNYRIPEDEIGGKIVGVVIAALVLIPLLIFVVIPVLGFFLGVVHDPWGFVGEVVDAAM